MGSQERQIFRQNALERYRWANEKEILPRVVTPSAFVFLWILLGVVILAGGFAWFGSVPTIATGAAAVTQEQNGQVSAVVFFEPGQLSALKAGQEVELTLNANGQRVKAKIETVSSTVLSPAEARSRYNLDALAVIQPAAVATVRLPANLSELYRGSLLPAHVETGSRRLISFLPGLDWLGGA
ncbi:MAG TPA: hypothetical protein VH186_04850 [Chloroflexia bacterium]|nr:hypothetical protein [Chloroflexia bacterium]